MWAPFTSSLLSYFDDNTCVSPPPLQITASTECVGANVHNYFSPWVLNREQLLATFRCFSSLMTGKEVQTTRGTADHLG